MREIEFKHPKLKDEWIFRLHPRVRDAIHTFDAIAGLLNAPATVITCIERSAQENAKVGGHPKSFHVARPGEGAVRAADLRNEHYSEPVRIALAAALKAIAAEEKHLDVVVNTHGTGPHFHLEWEGL